MIEFLFFIANLFPEIIVIVDDGSEFLHQSIALTPFFGIPKILRIGLLFQGGEIPIRCDQLSDSLFHHRPLHDKLRIFLFISGRKTVKADALAVVVLPNAAAGDRIAITTGSIFLLQKSNVGFLGFVLLELFKDPQLSLGKTAATHQHIVNGSLGNIKTWAVFGLGVVDDLLLFCLGRQGLFAHIQPCVHKEHAFNTRGNRPPLHIHFTLTGKVSTSPKVEHIVIGTIADQLAITEDLLNEGVIEVALQKITALFSVRMGRKEHGNFHSMIL